MMYLGKDAVGLATSLPVFSNLAKIEVGEYTPEQDEDANNKVLTHSLGEEPDFLFCWGEFDYGVPSVVYMVSANLIKVFPAETYNTVMYLGRLDVNSAIPKATTGRGSWTSIMTTNYDIDPNSQFRLIAFTGALLKAGVTYHYIIGKFKEVTANANE